MPLTDTAIRNAKASTKPYKLADGGGLFLFVAPTGGKLWRLKCRYHGKEQLLSFGAYPAVSLAHARERREEAKRQLAEGKSPALEKKRATIVARAAQGNTFAKVAEELIAKREREGMARTTADKLRWHLTLFGAGLGERPIGEIEPFEILEPLQRVEASGRHESATNALALAGRVFRYAVATGRARRDVAADLKGSLTAPQVTHHAAILDAKGAGQLLRAIDAYSGRLQTRFALLVMAHAFPRPGELRHAEWGEFDLDTATWRIPAHRTKMRKEHAIPLSTQVVAILRQLHAATGGTGLVLRSPRGARPLSENTMNVALRTMGYEKGQMTSHGFRAMASTLLNESGKWSPDAIERALAHGDSDAVRAAYHRGRHWAERVAMMQWWSDQLDALRDGAEIVPFRREA